MPDALPYAGGGTTPQSLAWDADGNGVTYVRLPLPGSVPSAREQFDAQLYHHALGTPASADTSELGKPPSPIAEHKLISSAHGGHAAAFIYYGDGNFENVYLRSGRTWRKVLGIDERVRTVDSETAGAHMGGRSSACLVLSRCTPRAAFGARQRRAQPCACVTAELGNERRGGHQGGLFARGNPRTGLAGTPIQHGRSARTHRPVAVNRHRHQRDRQHRRLHNCVDRLLRLVGAPALGEVRCCERWGHDGIRSQTGRGLLPGAHLAARRALYRWRACADHGDGARGSAP